jgi:predicted anti-sigma-YlaC factor YlaD
MITCQKITEDASAHLDNSNSLTRRLALQFHLLMCHRCRRFFNQFKIAVDVSQKLNVDNEPTEVEIEEVLRKLQARDDDPPAPNSNQQQ